MRRRLSTNPTQLAAHDDIVRGGDGAKGKDSKLAEEEKLKSIRSCYTYAFVAGAVGIVTILLEYDLSQPLDLAARLAVLLHEFVFGVCLYKIWCINVGLSSDAKCVSPSSLLDITSNFSRLWLATATVVTFGAVALSTTLPPSLPFQPWVVVLGIGVVGYASLYASANRAIEQVEAKAKPATDAFASARLMGFRSVRNMLLCLGSFALLGLVQIFTSLASPGIVAKGLGLSDVAESFAIVGLLAVLNRSSLHAVVAVTDSSELDPNDFASQNEAEKEFFDKVAGVYRSLVVAKVLSYVVAAFKTLFL